MMIRRLSANNITSPIGINKQDSSSDRVSDEVSGNMQNNPGGATQIETQPGDTLESVAKGSLSGSGQKMDIGNLLFEQKNIVSKNFDKLKQGMGPNESPNDFRTLRGKELPSGIKLDLQTTHTQNSLTPANPMERSPNAASTTSDNDQSQQDPMKTQNNSQSNSYAGAGSISDTQYAIEMQNISLSDEAMDGVRKYLRH